jgi:hypothetical protein
MIGTMRALHRSRRVIGLCTMTKAGSAWVFRGFSRHGLILVFMQSSYSSMAELPISHWVEKEIETQG